MEKSQMLKVLSKTKIIAHRLGYQMTDYPENSFEVLLDIFSHLEKLNSADGFEFDVCFTKDSIPIVLHDKFIDDVTDKKGLVSHYTYAELRDMDFSFRRSKKEMRDKHYKVMSLDDILTFFNDNIELVKDKEIKIETKDYLFTKRKSFTFKNFRILAEIINRYPNLNITHLSYWPLNLIILRRIQKKNYYHITNTDFLCELNILLFFTRFMPFLTRVSLRIKDCNGPVADKNNSKSVNKKIKRDNFWMKKSNVINEKNIRYSIEKFGSVGFYTLNNLSDIEEFSKHISYKFFKDNAQYVTFTSNNPFLIRNTYEKK